MREFSKVYRTLWQSRKFSALPDDAARYLYIYILTGPHCNSSGCYDLKLGYAIADLNWSEHDYRKAIESLSEVGLIEVEELSPTVLITNWVEFNEPTNAKHALGIMSQLDNASHDRLKTKRAQEFIEVIDNKKQCNDRLVGAALERVCLPYRKPIESVSAPRLRPRPEITDLDQDQIETKTREEDSRPALRALAVNGALAPQEGAQEKVKEEFPDLPDRLNRLLDTPLMRRSQ